jgi:hypothetical protein
MNVRKRWRVVGCGVLAALAVGAVWLFGYERTRYIDVNGGRQRTEVRIFGLCLRNRVEGTPTSALYERLAGPLPAPDWRPETSWTGMTRGHSLYRGSVSVAYWLPEALAPSAVTDEARIAVVEAFLRLLREDENSRRAEDYAVAVSEQIALASDSAGPGTIGPDDLLPAPDESAEGEPFTLLEDGDRVWKHGCVTEDGLLLSGGGLVLVAMLLGPVVASALWGLAGCALWQSALAARKSTR